MKRHVYIAAQLQGKLAGHFVEIEVDARHAVKLWVDGEIVAPEVSLTAEYSGDKPPDLPRMKNK